MQRRWPAPGRRARRRHRRRGDGHRAARTSPAKRVTHRPRRAERRACCCGRSPSPRPSAPRRSARCRSSDLCADHGRDAAPGAVTPRRRPGAASFHTDRRETIDVRRRRRRGRRARRVRRCPGALVFDGHPRDRRAAPPRRRGCGRGEIGTRRVRDPRRRRLVAAGLRARADDRAPATEGRSRIAIVTPERTPLERLATAPRCASRALLDARGIDLVTGQRARTGSLPAGLETTTRPGQRAQGRDPAAARRAAVPRVPSQPRRLHPGRRAPPRRRAPPNLDAAGDGRRVPGQAGWPCGAAGRRGRRGDRRTGGRAGRRPSRSARLRALLLTGSLPLFLRGGEAHRRRGVRRAALAPGRQGRGQVPRAPGSSDRLRARLGTRRAVRPTAQRADAHAHRETTRPPLDLALALADDEAEAGDPAARSRGSRPPSRSRGPPARVRRKRRRWTLGTPDPSHAGARGS